MSRNFVVDFAALFSGKLTFLNNCSRVLYRSRVYIYNEIKKFLMLLIHSSYRNRIVPPRQLIRVFEEPMPFHFFDIKASELVENTENRLSLECRFREEFREPRLPKAITLPLKGLTSKWLIHSRIEYKYHLKNTILGLAETVRGLGCDVEIISLDALRDLSTKSRLTMLNCDFLMFDSEMRLGEDAKFIHELRSSFRAHKAPKFIMHISDMWRPEDVTFIKFMEKSVDIFLHSDLISVRESFRNIEDKFHLWPHARSFASTKNLSRPRSANRSPVVFYGGTARQSDRIEILRAVIKQCRGLRISPDLLVWDTLIPHTALDNDAYIRRIQESECSLALSQKSSKHFIITARSIEVLATPFGGVLLQQEGTSMKPLSILLKRDEEFLSFSSESELRDKLIYISNFPHEVKSIADKGHAAISRIFSIENISFPFLS